MKTLLCAAAFAAAMVTAASAETRYDRALEKAAIAVVAGKMGDLRGGFSYKHPPQFVVTRGEVPPTPSVSDGARNRAADERFDGMAPAAERPGSRTNF